MLQKLRDKTSGWIAGTVLGLLTIPFAFFGMEQYLFQRNDTSAAKIEAPPAWWADAPDWWPATLLWRREVIDGPDFQAAFQKARQSQQAAQGDNFDARAFESPENKRKVLDDLIDERVESMYADEASIAASDAQVKATIEGIPAFQVAGRFDPQQYRMVLASQVPARTPREFQQQIRSDIARLMVPQALVKSGFATQAEVDRLLRLLGERRDATVAVMPAPAPDAGAVSAAEIQSWYDAHAADYRAPETVRFEYVDIDGSSLPAPAPADEATLRQRYEQEKSRFVDPEERLASHILVKVDADADAAAQAAAKARAEKLAAEARAPGADFAALARAQSDDAGSRDAGGDLGWVTRDTMPKEFEDALYAMEPGSVVGPVKTDFGWHVIKLREVKKGKQTPFEAARDQLAAEQAEADRERAFNDLIGRLVDQVLKNPNSLAAAAKEAGLPVRKAGPVARGEGEGVVANPAVQRAAFSESLIEDGTVSDPVEVGPNHSVLIRVTAHEPERAQPLKQVADRVIAAIRRDRAAKAAEAEAEAILERVKGGASLADIAAEKQWLSSNIPAMPRGLGVPDAETAKAIFALPKPAEGKVSVGKQVLGDGRISLFSVSKVIPGDPAEATDAQKQQLRSQLAENKGVDDAEALLKALRKRMKISVADDRL